MATTLKIGSKGESVKSLQKKLGIKADGIFGKQTDAAVRAYQSKNNLTSDGIVGSKTSTKLSGGSSKSKFEIPGTEPKMSKPGSVSYNKYGSSKPTPIGSIISSAPKKTKVGSFLSKIGSTFKDALGASAAKSGYSDNEFTYNDGVLSDATKINIPFAEPIKDITNFYNNKTYTEPKETFSGNIASANTEQVKYNSQNTPLVETSSVNPDTASIGTTSGITSDQYAIPEVNNTPTDNKVINKTSSNTIPSENTDAGVQTFATGSNPGILNNINMANNNFGVNSSSINNPWDVKSDKSEFQGAEVIKYADTASKSFTSPEEAMKFFNTPQGMASIKKFTDAGGKVEDIINRVPKTTNGVVAPQTFQEFESKLKDLDPTNQAMLNEYANSKLTGFTPQTMDTKNVPADLKGVVDAQNKELVMKSNYLNEREKMLYNQASQDLLTAQEERDAYQKITDARETAIERKTDILTKQYKADMKAEEAETEMNRITARKNLTEFLAQIGALRTDGNAQLGIETLDQRYQAQKTAIRSKYQTLIGNAQAEADEKISDLQYNLKMNTLELYKDLNKTDREIRMETMKMKYDYEKDVLGYNTKYQEKLADLREKQKSDANKANNDWRNAYFTLSAGDMFASLPVEFRNQWLINNQISPEGFKTTQGDLSKDFGNWSKNQKSGVQMTPTQEYNLQKQGVDVEAYKTDAEYRAAVNSQLE